MKLLTEGTTQAERALRETKSFLDSVVENLPIIVFIKEAKDLRFVFWNKRARNFSVTPKKN